MGNRAVVFFEDEVDPIIGSDTNRYPGVYLHWNGGPDSVYAFLEYMREVGVRSSDYPYARARFAQIVGNFFGGTLSIGIECYTLKEACTVGSDNGVYIVRWRDGEYSAQRCTWNGKWFTPEEVRIERDNIKNSRYWKNTPNILQDLRDKNDSHFKTT